MALEAAGRLGIYEPQEEAIFGLQSLSMFWAFLAGVLPFRGSEGAVNHFHASTTRNAESDNILLNKGCE